MSNFSSFRACMRSLAAFMVAKIQRKVSGGLGFAASPIRVPHPKYPAGSARYVGVSAGTLGVGAQHRCDRSTSARPVGLQLVHGGNAIKVASKNLNMAGAPAVVHCSTCHVVKSMTTTARRRSRNLPLQAMSATLPMACAGKFGARCGRLRHAKGLNFGPVAN